MGRMRCARIASACAGLFRTPSRPPCTAGCSVLTRPSIISGKPVSSLTSSAFRPASLSVLRVPPVETSSMPKPASSRANSTIPDLSETEIRAREARRRCSVMAHLYSLARLRGRVGTGFSQRQPRFLVVTGAACRAGARRRGGTGLLEAPKHARGRAGVAVDDHLHRLARALAAGEINAVLEIDAILGRAKRPNLLVRRHQHDAMAVTEPGGLHRRVEMEAHREFILRRAQLHAAVGVQE